MPTSLRPIAPKPSRRRISRVFALAPALALVLAAPTVAEVRVRAEGSGLAATVAAAIEENVPLAPAADLRVSASSGVVTVSGWTSTLGARERVAAIAESTCGVRFLQPRLAVRPPPVESDEALRQRVREVLAGGQGFREPASIEVTVAGGVVRLGGFTGTYEDALIAEELVSWTDGPRRIENEIRVDPVEGRRRVVEGLKRGLAARGIDVASEDLEIVESGDHLMIAGVEHDIRLRSVVERLLANVPGGLRLVRRETLLVEPSKPMPPAPYVAHPCD